MQCSFINIVYKILLLAVDIQCWCTCKHNKINCLVNPWLMQGIIIIKAIWATMESLSDFLYEIQINHSLLITFHISHTSQTCLWTVSESWRRFSSLFINKLTVCTCSNKFIIIACITVKVAADSEYYLLVSFLATVMPFGRLSVESEEVRKQKVNWQSYVQ